MVRTRRITLVGLLLIGGLLGTWTTKAIAAHRGPTVTRGVVITVKGRYPCEEDEVLEGKGDYNYPGVWSRYICATKDDIR